MSFLIAAILTLGPSAPQRGGWEGEFVMTIRGEGSVKKGPSTARWKIDREARGKIILDRRIEGAVVVNSPDRNNTQRYESWIGSGTVPFTMRVRDEIVERGPLFSPKEIRRDTTRLTCPDPAGGGTVGQGALGWPTLQIDRELGRYTWEAPRVEAPTRSFFQREFIEGPKAWTSRKPLLKDELDLGFQIIHKLNQPKEWFSFTGPIDKDATQITLSRSFPFTVMLMAGLTPPKVEAQLTLILRRRP